MGIRFYCPNGHRLNVKAFLAGKRGICPHCGAKVQIPTESTPDAGQQAAPRENTAAASASSSPAAEESGGGDGTPTVEVRQAGSPDENELPSPGDQPLPGPEAIPSIDFNDDVAFDADHPAPGAATPPELPRARRLPDDPLDEAPDAAWYVRLSDGEQFGPATAEVMRQWLGEGRIGGECLVWREGWRDWRQAVDTFPALRDGLMPEINAAGRSRPSGVKVAGAYAGSARKKSNTVRAVVITVLLLMVIVGSVALVWVMSK